MYESFYGLKANPFRLAPDPNFFFESSGHKRGLAYLRYGLHQAQGFVVVTGIPGTGKSMLVQTLLSDVAGLKLVVASLTSTNLGAEDILQAISMAFDFFQPGSSKASLLAQIEEFLISQAHRGRRVLLIVDEAQNLPPKSLEELRMLSNFQLGGQSLMQTILLGQQQLQRILESPDLEQLTQRVIASCHLRPLEAEETRAYIRHRLLKVGWRGDPSFSAEALRLIHLVARGIPRLINIFCDRMLLAASLDERHEIDDVFVRSVVDELHGESAGSGWVFGDESVCSDVELFPLPNGDIDKQADSKSIIDLSVASSPKKEVQPHAAGAAAGSVALAENQLIEEEELPSSDDEVQMVAEKAAQPVQTSDSNVVTLPVAERARTESGPILQVGKSIKPSISQKLTTILGFLMMVGLLTALYFIEPVQNQIEEFTGQQEPDAPLFNSKIQDLTQVWDGDDTQPEDVPVDAQPIKEPHEVAVPVGSEFERRSEPEVTVLAVKQEKSQDAKEATPENSQKAGLMSESTSKMTSSEETKPVINKSKPVDSPQMKITAEKPIVVGKPKQLEKPPTLSKKTSVVPSVSKAAQLPKPQFESAPIENEPVPIKLAASTMVRLEDLLLEFVRAYEGGDLGSFADLFTEDAIVDESEGKRNIADDYRDLFQGTEKRSISFKNMDWKGRSGVVMGQGDFVISVLEQKAEQPMGLAGKVEMEVVEINKRLMIYRLSHKVEL